VNDGFAGSYSPQDAPPCLIFFFFFLSLGCRWREGTSLGQLACARGGLLCYQLPALASHGLLCPLNGALEVLL